MSDLTIKQFFNQESIQLHVKKTLGQRSQTFITSVLAMVNQNSKLNDCDPSSIYQCALVATTLDLPINQNFGHAYIIPYKDKKRGMIAQFQIGYKGFIQLAQRSGQFKTIGAAPIYEGQIVSNNPLTGFEFDFSIKSSKLVGYAAYFKLLNGFDATFYMTKEEITAHGKKYSYAFSKGFGLWNDDFESMARKTVLKLLIQRYAPLSVEMQKATIADQSAVIDVDTMDVDYVDNTPILDDVTENQEQQRIIGFIDRAKTKEELQEGLTGVVLNEELNNLLEVKLKSL